MRTTTTPRDRRWSLDGSSTIAGAVLARWSAITTLAIVAVGGVATLAGQGSDRLAWATMAKGSAAQLLLLAGVVLIASGGWSSRTQRWCIAATLITTATTVSNILAAANGPEGALQWVEGVAAWTPNGQTASMHLLLALVLLATPRRGALVAGLRVVGLVVALFTSATAVSAHAFGGAGYSFVPNLDVMTPIASLATLTLAVGVTAVAPNRWPMRVLIQSPSDRVLITHLLPFVAVVPVLGPFVTRSAQQLAISAPLAAALGPSATLLTLAWILGVVLRDHRRLVAEIQSRDAQMLSVLDELPVAVMLRGEDGRLVHLNPGAERYVARMGVEVEDVSASPSSLLDHVTVIDEDGRPYEPARLPVVSAARDARSTEATLGYELPDGSYAWYSIRAAPIPMTDGSAGTVVTLDDVTEQHETRRRVALAERSLRLTFDHAPIGIAVIAPDGGVLQVNTAMCDLLGSPAAELMAGGLERAVHPDDQDTDGQLLASWLLGDEPQYLIDRRFRHASGRWVVTQMSVAVIHDEHGAPVRLIAQVVDLTEHRALEQELRAAAIQDPLTGLANRRALSDQLAVAQRRRHRDGSELGLLYLDLDDFKTINDTFGHDAGDRLLIAAGDRLRAATRDSDLVCRIGGDEFVVLCTPIDGEAGLRELVERLANQPPLVATLGDVEIEVRDSIGAVLVAPDEDIDAALRRADAAMYASKRTKAPAPASAAPAHT